MLLRSREDIIRLIRADEWMMDILRASQSLNLPDWWVCAGFVRSKIWDTLHGFSERTPLSDVDFIYYDASNIDKAAEKQLEIQLKRMLPYVPWSVKNQARMHLINHIPPYLSSVDAISKFPETATALGLKLDDQDHIVLTAPHGIDDVLQMIIKPTPFFSACKDRLAIYEKRIIQKKLKDKWNRVTII
ncbi:nucleotidyltransferase family protein [Paenibacillus sp. 2TAB23]|uniref:nucleotidyltransferase family protein n=1 Tax=Paenibacillus sp. 2TAB23 TaxID=3233004 RepID=UPI003F9E3395